MLCTSHTLYDPRVSVWSALIYAQLTSHSNERIKLEWCPMMLECALISWIDATISNEIEDGEMESRQITNRTIHQRPLLWLDFQTLRLRQQNHSVV